MREVEQLPFVYSSRTSREAGRSIVGQRARLQTVVYLAIRSAGPYDRAVLDDFVPAFASGPGGMTDEEGSESTELGGSTYRPRRIELVRQGRVRDSGATRLTRSGRHAVVWEAVT